MPRPRTPVSAPPSPASVDRHLPGHPLRLKPSSRLLHFTTLKEPDIAAQEYVNWPTSIRTPNSCPTLTRLGTHFLKKAATYEKAKTLLASGEAGDKDAAFEGEAMEKMAHKEYFKTAKIFERLRERFPTMPSLAKPAYAAGKPICAPARPKIPSMPSWRLPMKKDSTRKCVPPPCIGPACVTKHSATQCRLLDLNPPTISQKPTGPNTPVVNYPNLGC